MKIAIIGTIGSGKSEALKVAREMGFATLSADEINGELLASPKYIALLSESFEEAVKDGKVDRAALAKAVFSDEKKRARLNALAHPRILARIAEAKEDPLFVEMPLYAEAGAAKYFDVAVLVTCSDKIRRERLRARGMKDDDIEARIAAQDKEAKICGADRVLINDGSLQEFCQKAKAIFESILRNKC